jgi:hypothetical protein
MTSASARPVIALLTDFGTRDHYVGTMKGVMLGICREATFVDITHDVPAQDVLAGTLELAAACRYFPAGAIFLVVVDPGVGSARRAVAVEAGGWRFVAPDNGVLTAVLDEWDTTSAVELTAQRYALPTMSRTFEGRDRFAPAAAWLARGVEMASFGPPARELQRIAIPTPRVTADAIAGEVLRVDRFGNLITNVDRRTLDAAAGKGAVEIRIGSHAVSRLVATYADVDAGDLCALVGSSEYLEVAVRGGSAADRLRVGRGAPVHVARRA